MSIMKRVSDLLGRRKAVVDKSQEIIGKADRDQDGTLTAEQQAEIEQARSEIAAVDGELTALHAELSKLLGEDVSAAAAQSSASHAPGAEETRIAQSALLQQAKDEATARACEINAAIGIQSSDAKVRQALKSANEMIRSDLTAGQVTEALQTKAAIAADKTGIDGKAAGASSGPTWDKTIDRVNARLPAISPH